MSFPRYPQYKDSGVEWLGEVPEHWEVCALKRIVRMESGDGITSEDIDESGLYPVFGGNGLRGYASKWNHNGDYVLIGRQGALCGNINYAEGRFFASEHAVIATPLKTVITRWLGEMLRAMNLNQYSISAAQPGLSVEVVGNLQVPFPMINEQTLIAAFLDRETAKIDALVAEQERLIELLKEKRQAVISHAVTKGLNPDAPMKPSGIEWLGDVPEHWSYGSLCNFWEVVDCKHVTVPFMDSGFPVVSVMEVRSFDLDLSQVLRTDKLNYELLISGGRQPVYGDIIYCRNTANTGTSAYVNTQELIAVGQDVSLIKSRKQNGRYLNYILHGKRMADQLKSLMVGSTFKRINVADIKKLKVQCPPLAEQEAIVQFIETRLPVFDSLTAEAQRAITLLQERRTALISAAVTGKIDVRNVAPTEAA